MSGAALPAIAARGKEFAVARLSHVCGDDVHVVVSPGRYGLLLDAAKAAEAIDWRLQPTVVLVDRQRP